MLETRVPTWRPRPGVPDSVLLVSEVRQHFLRVFRRLDLAVDVLDLTVLANYVADSGCPAGTLVWRRTIGDGNVERLITQEVERKVMLRLKFEILSR